MRRLPSRPGSLLAALVLSLVALGAVGAAAAAGADAASRYHLDCGASGSAADGSRAEPLHTLEQASALVLGPGDRLLLRRGSECDGTLELGGSGSSRRPVVVAPYGRGPLPLVSGVGSDALVLRDLSHLIARRLALTNPGDGSERKRGIYVVATEGVMRDVVVRRMRVFDVGGDLSKAGAGSGGILVHADGPPPVRFARLRIARNRISDVSRSGISIQGTTDKDRPTAEEPWPEASTRVHVHRNRIDRIAGDGIVPRGTVAAQVGRNVVSRGNLAGRHIADPRGFVCNAGIWTFHANRTLIQRNEVFGMEQNGCDGTGFDVDYNQDGTIVQFNYSHDNEGGFILLCGDEDRRTAEVRFNLSVDDAAALNLAPCRAAEGKVGDLAGLRIFNNVFVAPRPRVIGEYVELNVIPQSADMRFANNVIYATEPQTIPFPCGDRCDHNLFHNLPGSGAAAVIADPRFADPARRGRGRLEVGDGFRLGAGSAARGAGTQMPAAPRGDFFGNPLPEEAPSIGLDQG